MLPKHNEQNLVPLDLPYVLSVINMHLFFFLSKYISMIKLSFPYTYSGALKIVKYFVSLWSCKF